MATGKHIGKVVVKVRDEEENVKICKPATKFVNAIPRTYMNPDKSYILVGELIKRDNSFRLFRLELLLVICTCVSVLTKLILDLTKKILD